MAEVEVGLAVSRSMVARTGATLDAFFGTRGLGALPMDGLHEVMKDFQGTKWVVTRQAIEVVDLALTVSGGAGYLSRSPLSRALRIDPVIDGWCEDEARPRSGT